MLAYCRPGRLFRMVGDVNYHIVNIFVLAQRSPVISSSHCSTVRSTVVVVAVAVDAAAAAVPAHMRLLPAAAARGIAAAGGAGPQCHWLSGR